MKFIEDFIKEATRPKANTPRKGTLAWEIMQSRIKHDNSPERVKHIDSIGNPGHMYGTAKVIHLEPK